MCSPVFSVRSGVTFALEVELGGLGADNPGHVGGVP